MEKTKIQEVIDAMPSDVDLDAFWDRLYLLRKIELAEQQIERGEVVSHEDARKRFQQWLD